MSQSDVLSILEELGGTASLAQIRERARVKYTRGSLHAYVHVRLRQLEKSGRVKRVESLTGWVWALTQPDSEGEVNRKGGQ